MKRISVFVGNIAAMVVFPFKLILAVTRRAIKFAATTITQTVSVFTVLVGSVISAFATAGANLLTMVAAYFTHATKIATDAVDDVVDGSNAVFKYMAPEDKIENPLPTHQRQILFFELDFTQNGKMTVNRVLERPFRGRVIVCTEDVVGATQIDAVMINTKSQLPTFQNPILSNCFSGQSDLLLDLASKGDLLQFQIACKAKTPPTAENPIKWTCSLIGDTPIDGSTP